MHQQRFNIYIFVCFGRFVLWKAIELFIYYRSGSDDDRIESKASVHAFHRFYFVLFPPYTNLNHL